MSCEQKLTDAMLQLIGHITLQWQYRRQCTLGVLATTSNNNNSLHACTGTVTMLLPTLLASFGSYDVLNAEQLISFSLRRQLLLFCELCVQFVARLRAKPFV